MLELAVVGLLSVWLCLQVYLSSMPLADLAASISEEEQRPSSDEEDQDELDESDSNAILASVVSTSSSDDVKEELQNHPVLQSSDGAADEQPSSTAAVEQLTSDATDEEELTSDAADAQNLASDTADAPQLIPHAADEEWLMSYAADASALGMVEDNNAVGGSTLVVRKGQQLQELLVSGSITQEELKHEVEKIVSFLMSPEDV